MEGTAGIVTGAASGIGRACALRFGAEGAAVVAADLESSREAGEEVGARDRAGRRPGRVLALRRRRARSTTRRWSPTACGAFGQLDFAHNNAGIGVHQLLHETPDEDFDRVIAVNLRGTFLGMKHQIRQMLAQRRRRDRQHLLQRRPAGGDDAERVRGEQARDPRADQERGGRVRRPRDPCQRRVPGRDHDAVDGGPAAGAPAGDPRPAGDDPVRRSGRGGRRGRVAVLASRHHSSPASRCRSTRAPWPGFRPTERDGCPPHYSACSA